MSYKTILVQIDDAKNLDARIEIAAGIAAAEGAHVIGVALTGIGKFIHEVLSIPHNDPNFERHLKALRKKAENELNEFENIAQRLGVQSFEKRMVDEELGAGISVLARCCDLVVLGQPAPLEDASSSLVRSDFPEYVIMHCGGPGLVIPWLSTETKVGETILIAWNASVEAARAVRNAIPLLQRAKSVLIVIFNPQTNLELYGDPPGAELAHALARHNVKVADILTPTTDPDTDTGKALLVLAGTLASDLIVMGCYSHSRFREIITGGVTATVLASTTIPALMSH